MFNPTSRINGDTHLYRPKY